MSSQKRDEFPSYLYSTRDVQGSEKIRPVSRFNAPTEFSENRDENDSVSDIRHRNWPAKDSSFTLRNEGETSNIRQHSDSMPSRFQNHSRKESRRTPHDPSSTMADYSSGSRFDPKYPTAIKSKSRLTTSKDDPVLKLKAHYKDSMNRFHNREAEKRSPSRVREASSSDSLHNTRHKGYNVVDPRTLRSSAARSLASCLSPEENESPMMSILVPDFPHSSTLAQNLPSGAQFTSRFGKTPLLNLSIHHNHDLDVNFVNFSPANLNYSDSDQLSVFPQPPSSSPEIEAQPILKNAAMVQKENLKTKKRKNPFHALHSRVQALRQVSTPPPSLPDAFTLTSPSNTNTKMTLGIRPSSEHWLARTTKHALSLEDAETVVHHPSPKVAESVRPCAMICALSFSAGPLQGPKSTQGDALTTTLRVLARKAAVGRNPDGLPSSSQSPSSQGTASMFKNGLLFNKRIEAVVSTSCSLFLPSLGKFVGKTTVGPERCVSVLFDANTPHPLEATDRNLNLNPRDINNESVLRSTAVNESGGSVYLKNILDETPHLPSSAKDSTVVATMATGNAPDTLSVNREECFSSRESPPGFVVNLGETVSRSHPDVLFVFELILTVKTLCDAVLDSKQMVKNRTHRNLKKASPSFPRSFVIASRQISLGWCGFPLQGSASSHPLKFPAQTSCPLLGGSPRSLLFPTGQMAARAAFGGAPPPISAFKAEEFLLGGTVQRQQDPNRASSLDIALSGSNGLRGPVLSSSVNTTQPLSVKTTVSQWYSVWQQSTIQAHFWYVSVILCVFVWMVAQRFISLRFTLCLFKFTSSWFFFSPLSSHIKTLTCHTYYTYYFHTAWMCVLNRCPRA